MTMKRLRSVAGIVNPYSRRILTRVINKDPLKILAATPARLGRLIRGLTKSQLRRSPERGKWSIAQLVNHLSDSEIVFAFRLRMAIAQSGAPLQAIDEGMWAKGLGYRNADIGRKLAVFEALRRDHVRMLKALPQSAWNRYGMHQERGKETVLRIAQMFAGHDLNHLQQIRSIRSNLAS
jgi:hypothetical protein